MRTLLLSLAAVALLAPSTAFADDGESPVSLSMNVGGFGVLGFDEGWQGQYLYFGPSAFIPMGERLAFIPMVTVQSAPGSGYWGFAGTTMLEIIPPKGPIAIDLVPTIGTDTAPDGSISVWWGVGPGITATLPSDHMLGFAIQAAGVFGQDWVGAYPMINYALPM